MININNNNNNKMTDNSNPQPQVITLNMTNSIELLSQYIEVAQKAGTFILSESDILKRCRDVLMRGTQDHEINTHTAKNLFIQAVTKGQSKGAYSLEEASVIHKICQFVTQNIKDEVIFPHAHTQQPKQQQPQQEPQQESVQKTQLDESDDLSDDLESLSDPVPLRSGPRVI